LGWLFLARVMGVWERPDENSIEGLVHGMGFADGVELDLRVDADGEFVIFHDEFVPGSGPILDRCVEKLSTEHLKSAGVVTLDQLLRNRDFTDPWRKGGKTVDIEFKLPHPSTKIETVSHLGSMIKDLEFALESLELPERSTVVSSFSPKIGEAAKSVNSTMPVTRLIPHIRSWGKFWRLKRIVAMPNFARTTVKGVASSLRDEGMEAIGMALNYVVGWPRFVHPGKPVGLHGRGLRRFFEARRGMGAFIWPCPLRYEDALLNAGVSLVTDNMDPTLFEKPDGTPRWPRPGSQPLDEEWGRRIGSADSNEKGDVIGEAASSLPMWDEMEVSRKRTILDEQGSRMLWPGNSEKWSEYTEGSLPWGSPRIIGHRGSGAKHSVKSA